MGDFEGFGITEDQINFYNERQKASAAVLSNASYLLDCTTAARANLALQSNVLWST